MLAPHSHDAAVLETLRAELERPSLYDVALDLLRKTVPEETSSKDAWIAVYRAPQDHWALYQLAEKLVDLEDYLRRWRFNHVTTVSRVIGMKRGTGGTSGTDYLKRMLEVVLFPDLWDIRTDL
jgi:tryptophan 2,3-dioxygenase